MPDRRQVQHFTMVEMLTVISIITVIAAISMPAFSKVRNDASYTRWQAHSAAMSKDPALDRYYTMTAGSGTTLVNRALGDPDDAMYNASAKDGVFPDSSGRQPKWVQGKGRWRKKPTLQFDGNNDFIALKYPYFKNSVEQVTVCAWVRSRGNGRQIIISFDRSEIWRLSLEDDSASNVAWDTNSASNTDDLGTSKDYTDEKWHLIVGWYDGKDKRIYVDGQMVAEETNAHSGEKLGGLSGRGTTNATYGYIGVGSEADSYSNTDYTMTGPDLYFDGDIDEIAVYHRILSDGEIGDMYKVGLPVHNE